MTARTDAPDARFAAGPFDVLRRVGRGGMAEVWLGRHRVHHTEAAVKILSRELARDADLQRRLRAEVRAMAGLDHPHVATVLDAGALDGGAERASAGAVVAGSPWLAMSWLPHGDLGRFDDPQPWPVARALLLDVLDALAHAHARGVVHRDLKPGNVLLRLEDDAVRAVLTDFGIAQVIDRRAGGTTLDQRIAGTPEYMAPEQIRGLWRDVGPWTDLYALGCLAWQLSTGAPPFRAQSPVRLSLMHLTERPPRPALPADYPPAFADWMARLLAKDPFERFERAADAAAALGSCGPSADSGTLPLVTRLATGRAADDAPTRRVADAAAASAHSLELAFGATMEDVLAEAATGRPPVPPPAGVPPIDPRAPTGRPPRPDPAPAESPDRRVDTTAPTSPLPLVSRPPQPPGDWRPADRRRGLVGRAGPGLFGLRALPMIGRTAARDRLWRALQGTWRTRRPRVCVVQGASGLGRSRLVDWLVQRADELGAAYLLHATHGPLRARRDGLGGAIVDWFRGADLEPDALATRVDIELGRRAPEVDIAVRRRTREVLVDIVRDDLAAEQPGHHDAQIGALARWLRWIGRRRPIILRLDDAQWSAASLALAARLADREDLPLLVVLTLPQPTELAHIGADRVAAIARLEATPGVERVALGPLDADEMQALLVHGVGLAPAPARALHAAIGGNPLFAVQVVAEWLADGALTPGPGGLVPADGAMPPIPDSRLALGEIRLRRAIAHSGLPEGEGFGLLEGAAALGDAVALDDWASITGARRDDLLRLTSALLDAGLARNADGGWSFAHRFVREALVVRAREAGRARPLAVRCALAVLDPDPRDPRPAERQARYLLEGGYRAEAVDAFTEAARRALSRGTYRAAHALLDAADAAFAAAGLPRDDLRRVRLLALRAETARYIGQPDLADAALATLRRLPHPPHRPWARAELCRLDGQDAFYAGRIPEAVARYAEAEALFARAGDAEGTVRSLHGRGWALCAGGDHRAGLVCFEQGHALAESADLPAQAAWCLHGLAGARVWGGIPGGRAPAEEAAARFESLGQSAGYGFSLMHLSEALWDEGRRAEARELLDSSVATLRAAESTLMTEALLRRATMALEEGRLDAARADCREVIERLDAVLAARRPEALLTWVCLERAAGRHAEAAALFDQAAEMAAVAMFPCPATARLCDRVAAGFEGIDPARARRALELAVTAWQALEPRGG